MRSACDGAQIVGIGCFAKSRDGNLELFDAHPTVTEGDFLEAGDFESLMVFDGSYEL